MDIGGGVKAVFDDREVIIYLPNGKQYVLDKSKIKKRGWEKIRNNKISFRKGKESISLSLSSWSKIQKKLRSDHNNTIITLLFPPFLRQLWHCISWNNYSKCICYGRCQDVFPMTEAKRMIWKRGWKNELVGKALADMTPAGLHDIEKAQVSLQRIYDNRINYLSLLDHFLHKYLNGFLLSRNPSRDRLFRRVTQKLEEGIPCHGCLKMPLMSTGEGGNIT